jgi:hypothetical protein
VIGAYRNKEYIYNIFYRKQITKYFRKSVSMANRFRKVFVVDEGNSIFENMTAISIHKYRDHADSACKRLQEKAKEEQNKYHNADKPLSKIRVRGFYLVHEDLFRGIDVA